MLFVIYTLIAGTIANQSENYKTCRQMKPDTVDPEEIRPGNGDKQRALNRKLANFLLHYIPQIMKEVDDVENQAFRIANTEALLHVGLNLISLDHNARQKGELTIALQNKLFRLIYSNTIKDLQYPLDFMFNSTIVRLCNRHIVQMIEQTLPDLHWELSIDRPYVDWTTLTKPNCRYMVESANLEKKVTFLAQAMESCFRHKIVP